MKQFASLSEIVSDLVACRQCPRLTAWREQVGREKRRAYRDEDYWAKPVPGFGDEKARVLVLGLAPGAHGSNRTGRMFTGDDSGKFLYPALYRAGFANQPDGLRVDDGLQLIDLWITAVCRCVPPDNKPTRDEINTCRPWLDAEMGLLSNLQGIVALGKIAWDETFHSLVEAQGDKIPAFSHGSLYMPKQGGIWVLGSYHPSRQNTQTGRLSAAMFDEIWEKTRQLLMD
jgi:uracil-DNA glycosylase family 4